MMLLGRALEELRFGIEREQPEASKALARLNARLLGAGESGRIDGMSLLGVLRSISEARLEIDDRLRELLQLLIVSEPEDDEDDNELSLDFAGALPDLAAVLDGNVFEMQAFLERSMEALPAEIRVPFIAALLAESERPLHEMTVGFLLSNTPAVRAEAARALAVAARRGRISPVMLRRTIAVRNWVPASERTGIDAVIKAARIASVECAPWPERRVGRAIASCYDGAGAHSMLLAVPGWDDESMLCGVLGRVDLGVRDAWVRRDLPADELAELLAAACEQSGLRDATVDYFGEAIATFLGETVAAGKVAPFGLLDFAETAGLTQLNPGPVALEPRLDKLVAALDPAALQPESVEAALERSALWGKAYRSIESWFEDDAEVRGLVAGHPSPIDAVPRLLTGPLSLRRRKWADQLARSALAARSAGEAPLWQDMTIVARELLGERPIGTIPFMAMVAAQTSSAHKGRVQPKSGEGRKPGKHRKSKRRSRS